jgi:hypothetical protein
MMMHRFDVRLFHSHPHHFLSDDVEAAAFLYQNTYNPHHQSLPASPDYPPTSPSSSPSYASSSYGSSSWWGAGSWSWSTPSDTEDNNDAIAARYPYLFHDIITKEKEPSTRIHEHKFLGSVDGFSSAWRLRSLFNRSVSHIKYLSYSIISLYHII